MAHGLDMRTKLQIGFTYLNYRVRELYQWYRSSNVTVATRLGDVRGVLVTSAECSHTKYAQFTGIPYARPPVNELRFRDPQPADPWTGTFNASSESMAWQRDIFTARYCGQEDCLHLNIYTKQLESDAVRVRSTKDRSTPPPSAAAVPVMVFFHGGAYMFGCNNKEIYNPEFLLRRDVVLVTVNYRLGAFGFLSVDDPDSAAPGNAGLKDQVLALRWVRDNIAQFGGDPGNVTIFGESAGGCSVHYHLLSPMSSGLFHRAIVMSGAALTSWSICPLQQLPERLARGCGWDGAGGAAAMMRVLRAAKPEQLLRAQERLADRTEKRQYMMFTFGPKVEPYVAEQCFIGESPVRMCRAPWSVAVPVIFSACSNEGLLVRKATRRNPRLIENLQERFQDMVPLDLMPAGGDAVDERDAEETVALAAEFRRFYFADAEMTMAQLERFEQMMSDKLFLHGIYRSIRMRLEAAQDVAGEGAAAPTWYLRFDADSKLLNLTKFMFAGRDVPGACHADDCHYLFKTGVHPKLAAGMPELQAIDRFVNLWTEFARTGNPNGELTRPLVQWDPVRLNEPVRCLNFAADQMNYVELPEMERMLFWDSMYAKRQQKQTQQQKSSDDGRTPVASL